jgi:hypothetical protein
MGVIGRGVFVNPLWAVVPKSPITMEGSVCACVHVGGSGCGGIVWGWVLPGVGVAAITRTASHSTPPPAPHFPWSPPALLPAGAPRQIRRIRFCGHHVDATRL